MKKQEVGIRPHLFVYYIRLALSQHIPNLLPVVLRPYRKVNPVIKLRWLTFLFYLQATFQEQLIEVTFVGFRHLVQNLHIPIRLQLVLATDIHRTAPQMIGSLAGLQSCLRHLLRDLHRAKSMIDDNPLLLRSLYIQPVIGASQLLQPKVSNASQILLRFQWWLITIRSLVTCLHQ